MRMKEKRPQKRGDRRDAAWVKDAPGLNIIMANLYPNRTDCEVFLRQEIDITELLSYLEKKNGPDAPYKTTLFHCFVTMVTRVLMERPYLNRFVQGRRIYERNEITISFIAKKRFADHSEEAQMQYKPKGTDTLDDVSRQIVGEVHEMRRESKSQGINEVIDKFSKMPRLLLMFVVKVVRWLDFWGLTPRALTEGDANCATVLLSNLGSIKCPSVYHHLNNYGTTSILITIGTIHKEKKILDDGSEVLRDIVDIGATLDERIADGFYFARSLKLIQHICEHPELLDQPLEVKSEYEFV